ncbi:hypothetical protein COOONC_11052 [Cooperia oncophora]
MHEIVRHISQLQMDVQDGLMKELYMILTGCVLPSKLDPPRKSRLSLRKRYRDIFLCDSVAVRLAAVRCCAAISKPFVKVYEKVHREHRQWVLALIHGVLRSLVSAGVVDPRECIKH